MWRPSHQVLVLRGLGVIYMYWRSPKLPRPKSHSQLASSSSTGSRNGNRRMVLRSRCNCGDAVGKWTAWTHKNPGRRFIGCPNFMDEDRDCGYFAFIDSPLPNQWYKDLVYALHANMNAGNEAVYGEYAPQEAMAEVQEVAVVQANGGVGKDKWMMGILVCLVGIMLFVWK